MQLVAECIIINENNGYHNDFIFIPYFIDKNTITLEITRVDGTSSWGDFDIVIYSKDISNKVTVTILASASVTSKQVIVLPFEISSYESEFQLIPKVIHQTWESWDDNIPSELKNIVDTWKKLNPDYEHRIYDKTQRREYIRQNFDSRVLRAYDEVLPGAYKADLWRYCVLYNEGGFYADIKIRCYNSIKHFTDKSKAYFLIKDRLPHGIWNGMIGSVSKSRLLYVVLNRCVDNIINKNNGLNCIDITGPQMFGRCFNILRNIEENNGDISISNIIPEDTLLLDINSKFEPITDKNIPIGHLNNKVYRQTLVSDKRNAYTTMWMEQRTFIDQKIVKRQ